MTYYICNVSLENFNLSHVPVYIMGEEDLSKYGKLKKQLREYDAVKQNIDSILHPARGREQEKAL